ncbi:MAG TPA: sigma factor-like helix-turn-helix DNA-binding protein [Sedimentisphaerales bacterium]|nr:sigma factor-like helix-turn-helix DNA-binding protein [Sedimentisphaerales bacterium]
MSRSRTPSSNEHELARKRQRTLLADFVKRCLSSEERLIVTLHYCEALTLNEIAAVLTKSFEHVNQVHTRIQEQVSRQLTPATREQICVA